MLFSFRRLRLWLGLSALALLLMVAGFYIYARYRMQKALRNLPATLGVEVQQSTEGFTISKSEGGHTIFSVFASKAIQYKQGGRAELHEVRITSYGRNSDRLDEIYGSDFEYDPHGGDISAKGDVSIDLQAVAAGTSQPGQAPRKIGNPVHLKTSGIEFNKNTGIAHTAERIEFRLLQTSGWAQGARYESASNTLQLNSDVHLTTTGPRPAQMKARSAIFAQPARALSLSGAQLESGARKANAEHVLLHLRDDNTVERVNASGGVNVGTEGARPAEIRAATAEFTLSSSNRFETGMFSGGVSWQTGGLSPSRGSAGRILLDFASNNQVRDVRLRGNVELSQSGGAGGQAFEFGGEGLDLTIGSGRFLQAANSLGSARIVFTNAPAEAAPASPGGKSVITAGHFEVKFGSRNRMRTLTGSLPVKIVSSAPGHPDRVSTSRELTATFTSDATQALQEVLQTGDVKIQEGPRTASSESARYNQANDTVTLNGDVRFQDATIGATLTCNTLVFDRRTGQTLASGNVKTSYAGQRAQTPGAMLSPTGTVHVTAPQMVAQSSTGVARYSKGARLWQGGNIVQASVLDFNRNQSTLDADGLGSTRVSAVFVQNGANGRQNPLEVAAGHLHYDDRQRSATFEGAIVVHSADSTLQASHAVVTLKPQESGAVAGGSTRESAPSQVQSIDATGKIQVQQSGRTASGSHLVYTADEGKFVLTGTPDAPPSIFDAEHGKVTGDSLTFFNRDDRVLVDSSNSRTITQTRVKK